MFLDARTVPEGSLIEADLCIVGAGAAGITIAREFRASSLRVVLLESGWFTADEVTQSLYAGEVRERPYFPLDSIQTRCRYFGGTTNQWTGECRPFAALDFAQRDWVPDSGWPFDLEHLLPFYEKAQSVCQLGPFAYAARDLVEPGTRLIAFDDERFCSYAFHYSPPTRFGETYRDEIREASNIIAYLGANVVDLETPAPPSYVTGVHVACLSGNRFRVKARAVILATGGIENARLLLQANSVQSAGLGNTYDQVGRYFMEHLYLDRAAVILARAASIGEFYTSGHWSDGRRVRGILALSPAVQRQEKLTNYCAVVDEESLQTAVEGCRFLLGDLRRRRRPNGAFALVGNTLRLFGGKIAARLKLDRGRAMPRLFRVKNIMEQAPNHESRVVLADAKDELGCPRGALHWRLSAIDKRTAHRAHEILAEEFRRAGMGRLRSSLGEENDPWPASLRGARHHMGTTRMHTAPRRGVVDPDSRVHGIANLYIAGSSVFPTSGSANPTLTIVALALGLAEHLKHVLR
jgi:choline dehydrogenase-like flavoprotein